MKKEALETVYHLYSKELYLYAFSLCKNHHWAQDLVSDTFYKALLTFKADSIEIKYWLFRVCKNLWLDDIKRKKYFTNTPLEDNELTFEDNTLERLITNESKRELYRILLGLPPSSKEVIFLFYFSHMSLKDIGENMGISSGAARTLLCRARQKLKNVLKEDVL